jgi:hypothetical protein
MSAEYRVERRAIAGGGATPIAIRGSGKDALGFGGQASVMFALLNKHFGHKQANLQRLFL